MLIEYGTHKSPAKHKAALSPCPAELEVLQSYHPMILCIIYICIIYNRYIIIYMQHVYNMY